MEICNCVTSELEFLFCKYTYTPIPSGTNCCNVNQSSIYLVELIHTDEIHASFHIYILCQDMYAGTL